MNEYVNTGHANPELTLSFILFVAAFVLIGYAISAWLLGRIFHKAGISKGIAWVPFYNTWTMLKLGDQPGYWAILVVVPIVQYVSLVFMYIAMYRIGLKFGKEGWWVVIGIFVPIVWYAVFAFDDSKWQPEAINA